MKKIIRLLFLGFVFTLCFVGFTFTTVVAESVPFLKISAMNLSFQDNVYILYAVDSENISDKENIELLVWLDSDLSYSKGSENYVLTTTREDELDSGTETKNYRIFCFDRLTAKQMTDTVYARAYYTKNNTEYYSKVEKYSILQYAKNKKSNPNTSTALINLLNSMLEYGKNAQIYFNYHTERLATDTYYNVSLKNANFSDGTSKGLFKANAEITITAQDKEGYNFVCWKDENNTTITTEKTFNVTVTEDIEYTAVYEKESLGLEYQLINNNTEYEVTGIGTCLDTEIVIPTTYNNKPVTSIGMRAFRNCTGLTSITIPDSVTEISREAFSYCTNLINVTIGNSVTSIGLEAFSYCSNLINVTIPDSVTSVNNSTFYSCGSLTNVTIGNGLTSISQAMFNNCTSLISITIPDSVLSIGPAAFKYCSGLTSATIGNGVTTIGEYAFQYCSGLTDVIMGDSVTSIRYCAFEYCGKLTSVILPDSVISIGHHAFRDCTSLTNITLPDSVTSIGDSAFFGTSFERVYYKGTASEWENITIGQYNDELLNATRYYYSENYPTDFEPNTYWHYVDNLPTLWEEQYSLGLEYQLINNNTEYKVTGIGTCLDTEIVIPTTYNNKPVTSIGGEAFSCCTSLTSVTIPDGVTRIGNLAFWGCASLTSLTIPNGITSIGFNVFGSCTSLTEINVDSNNNYYKSIDGNLYTKDGTTLIKYALGKTATEFVIPDGVTSIENGAFSYCTSLRSIYYNGTIEEWNSILGEQYWQETHFTVYCTDGEIEINL